MKSIAQIGKQNIHERCRIMGLAAGLAREKKGRQETYSLEAVARFEEAQRELVNIESIERMLKEAQAATLVLRSHRFKQLRTLRTRLLKLERRSESDDITIRRRDQLGENVEKLRTELQGKCPHPFLVQNEGYAGSPGQEYENRRRAHRKYVLCGQTEEVEPVANPMDTTTVNKRFKCLLSQDGRTIVREPWKQDQVFYNIWRPLEEVLNECMDKEVFNHLG